MAVRSIRLFGDPVLRAAAVPIDEIDDGVRSLVADLVETVGLPGAREWRHRRSASVSALSATTSTA